METVFYNGKIYIEKEWFEQAVLISEGIIKKIGTNEVILAAASKDATLIDVKGKTIIPGMNDSHQHMGSIGEWLSLPDLSSAHSIDEVIQIGKRFITETPDLVLQGMYGVGWNQDYFTDSNKRMMDRHDMDRISTEIPIVFERVCGHIVVANTKAIEMAGITRETFFQGGIVELDESGEPNGVFLGTATYEILKTIPTRTFEEWEQLYIRAMEYAVSVGITSIQSNDARQDNSKDIFALMHKLFEEGKMPLRYRHQYSFHKLDSFEDFLRTEFIHGKYDNKFLSLGPLKLFKDGSLGARTALLKQEYHDDPENYGVETLSKTLMQELYDIAVRNGIQVITHVIGDAAIEQTLEIYEKGLENGRNTLRHGLVHCQITDSPILKRITKDDILAFVQPVFLNYDLHIAESRVGAELASTSYAFHSLDQLGVHVSYGTDAPIESCNPFFNIYSAVTRKDLSGYPEGGFYQKECVDVASAIDNYTLGSAYAEFKEDIKGRIKPGYYADLIVLDNDIFTISVDEIKNIQVELTMVDGRIVYQKNGGIIE